MTHSRNERGSCDGPWPLCVDVRPFGPSVTFLPNAVARGPSHAIGHRTPVASHPLAACQRMRQPAVLGWKRRARRVGETQSRCERGTAWPQGQRDQVSVFLGFGVAFGACGPLSARGECRDRKDWRSRERLSRRATTSSNDVLPSTVRHVLWALDREGSALLSVSESRGRCVCP